MCYTVYIIYSQTSDSFYKGQTKNFSERLFRHNSGYEKSTRNGIPWKLVWSIKKPDRSSALKLERKLKNLTRQRLIEFVNKYTVSVAGPDVTPEV